tara:strand:- start:1094 stop:1939 length:846 start_codon:yes stop_codon:yes gene_type:complete
MARGSLKDPFKKQEETPMKQVSGQQIGSTLGGVAGTAIGGPIGGIVGSALGGLVGGAFGKSETKDKTPASPSQAELDVQRRMQEFEDFQFRAVNPYEDMQVNLQAAEFQRDMQAQQQADTLQALRGAGGAAGAASLATAMSRQAAEKERAIAADIGRQEQEIKQAAAQQEVANQIAKQKFELDRMQTMLGIDIAKVTGEQQARLADEQGRLDRQSQLIGAGVSVLGTLGSSFIESGGLQPTTSSTSTPTEFADVSNLSINTSGLGQNLTLTTPSSGLSLNQ